MESPKPAEQPITPERAGKYTEIERKHFDTILGPGVAVSLESLRRITGARLKISRGGIKHPEVE
jgi:hypothetical protein